MAIATGVIVAAIYLNQPLLGLLEVAFPGHATTVRLVPTATQLGYAAGLLLLVPLGDIVARRTLILGQLVLLAVGLVATALAPSAGALLAASILVGIAACVAQQIIPFAAELAPPERRGKIVGTVMSGLLAGILGGRVFSGIVAAHAGWRAVFVLELALLVATFALLAATLPRRAPASRASYPALLASLVTLWRTEPSLRAATIAQASLFASFITFWTVLTLELDRAYGLGAQAAGLFGLVGVAGVLLAPMAGHSADQRGPRVVIGASIVLMILSWVVFAVAGSVLVLLVGVVLLDLGEQGAMVSHQHIIYALRPEARGRVNTVYVGGMFLGSGLGSAVAILAWEHGGWPAVCAVGACLCAVAFAAQRRLLFKGGVAAEARHG